MAEQRKDKIEFVQATFAGPAAALALLAIGEDRPKKALDLARKLLARGASEAHIYAETNKLLDGSPYAGVSYTADGQPRFEISDEAAKTRPVVGRDGRALMGDFLDHERYFEAYPEARYLEVEKRGNKGGGYTGDKVLVGEANFAKAALGGRSIPKDSATGVVLHELDHFAQDAENFPRGGSPRDFEKKFPGDDNRETRVRLYESLAGEVDAENTRNRQAMTAKQRRAMHPDRTASIPRSEQIVTDQSGSIVEKFGGDLPKGAFSGSQNEFESLSPGMRREIARTAEKLAAKPRTPQVEAMPGTAPLGAKAKPVGMDGLTRDQRAGRVPAPVVAEVPTAGSAMDRFRAAYEATLAEQVKANPSKYGYGADRVPDMAQKMTAALAAGNGDIQSPTVKAVAKAMGIKPTVGAIKAALNDQPPPAPKPPVDGLSARELNAAKRAINAGSAVNPAMVAKATNAQLQALDDASRAARQAQTGGKGDWVKINQIEAWRTAIRDAARQQTSNVVDAPPVIAEAVKHPGTPIPQDPQSTADWLADREQRINASKAAGKTHLDALPRAVEGMRGVEFVNVHDPKERGTVRTVANTGEVVVDWADDYSAEKNLAEPVKDGKKTVRRSWLAPTDLKDYVAEPKAASRPVAVKPVAPEVSPTSTVKMMGIPVDGSKPFVMAILDMAGDKQAMAAKNFKENAHLYTQKLAGYELVDKAGNKLIGFQNEATLNSALEAQGKAGKGEAKTPARVSPESRGSAKLSLRKTIETGDANETLRSFEIVRGAKVVGRVGTTVAADAPNRVRINTVGAVGKANSLGVPAVRGILRDLVAAHPGAQEISGLRVTGARRDAAGAPVEIKPVAVQRGDKVTVATLKAEAKSAGIKGYSSMTKAALMKALDKSGAVAMIVAPAVAAAVAFDATRADAKAAGDQNATAKGLAAGTVAGAVTAGVVYGIGKALGAGLQVVAKVSPAAAGPVGIAVAGGLTAYGAYNAYQEHKATGKGATAAALSLVGADQILHLGQRTPPGPVRLTQEQQAQYAAAAQRFAAMKQAANTVEPAKRQQGWSNAARIAAAKARGVEKLPYDGNPSSGPAKWATVASTAEVTAAMKK